MRKILQYQTSVSNGVMLALVSVMVQTGIREKSFRGYTTLTNRKEVILFSIFESSYYYFFYFRTIVFFSEPSYYYFLFNIKIFSFNICGYLYS